MAGSKKLVNLLIFTNQFASMMQSQLQLVDVLDNLARETPGKELREAVEEIAYDVRRGIDFGDSLANYPSLFNDIFVNVVRAGMEAGRLADSLVQVAVYLNKTDTINRKLKGALTYPLFMGVAFFLVFNAMVFFILPRFATMFAQMKKELPAPTRILLEIGEFWKDNWYLMIGGILLASLAMMVWISNREGRLLWDEYKLRIPVVGKLWRMAALARFLRTFAVQIRNEVPLLRSLRLAAASSNNLFIEEAILNIADEVERGVSVSQAFREHHVFSGIVLQMISAGEEAGNLSELLFSAADYFERLLETQTETVTGLINPIMTVTIGLVIAGMMVAAFLPVFGMANVAGGR
ncbi:MAG: type II secretion system F family protein [Magnetococcales bacterium]|nr:type II secretion system F family protein [Magnetococcales bacterium]MBF0150080.1 type II secretion system F family protein [Magnetococcales bacterium]